MKCCRDYSIGESFAPSNFNIVQKEVSEFSNEVTNILSGSVDAKKISLQKIKGFNKLCSLINQATMIYNGKITIQVDIEKVLGRITVLVDCISIFNPILDYMRTALFSALKKSDNLVIAPRDRKIEIDLLKKFKND